MILSGTVRIEGVELSHGDYLFTQLGMQHDVAATWDAVIFVSSQ